MFTRIILLMLFALPCFSQSVLYEQSSEVNNLMVQYHADRGSLNRFYFVEGAPDRRERLAALTAAYQKQLNQLHFESLPTGSRVDYILFKRNLDEQSRLLKKEQEEVAQLKNWFSFAVGIYDIEKIRRRGTQPNAQQWAASMKAITGNINQSAKALEKENGIDIALIRRAQGIIRGLQAALKSVHEFYNGYDPNYTWWIPETCHKLDSSLNAYAKLWQKKERSTPAGKDDGSGIIGYPIGREELMRQLQLEFIPYTPEDLVDIANREFAWCDAEMLKGIERNGFWQRLEKSPGKSKEQLCAGG